MVLFTKLSQNRIYSQDEIFASLDKEIGESIERQLLKINQTVINVSHIIYEANMKLYDIIYLVREDKILKVDSFQEIKDLDLFIMKTIDGESENPSKSIVI
ncbi:MAG: hypothetical protein GX974_00090 [Clostridiales bacterium]|nr:hypothetical protein [Clostridiales bacterium]